MLINSILIPFLALVSPFQNLVVDDFRAIYSDSRTLAVGKHRGGTLAGAAITGLLVGHILRYEIHGHPSLLEDDNVARPSQYVKEHISKPYISGLLRNHCIAQKIPAPPPPICINKAVKPSFEHAEKSPALPAFPIRRQTCSLQPASVFIDSSMTFLYPPCSSNILVFPEPAQSTILVGTSSALMATAQNDILGARGQLALALGILWIYACLIGIVHFKPSNCAPTICEDIEKEVKVDVDSVIPYSEPEGDIQREGGTADLGRGGLKGSDEFSATTCQSKGADGNAATSPSDSGCPVTSTIVPSFPDGGPLYYDPESESMSSKSLGSRHLPLTTQRRLALLDPKTVVVRRPSLPWSSVKSSRTGALKVSRVAPEENISDPVGETSDDVTTPPSTITVTPSVLDPKATAFVPRSSQPSSSIPATTPEPILSILDDVSETRSLNSSIHAPPSTPVLSLMDGPDEVEARSLGSSMHAPSYKEEYSADPHNAPKTRPMQKKVRVRAPKRNIVIPDLSKRCPLMKSKQNVSVLDLLYAAKARSLRVSIHAPVIDVPIAPKGRSLYSSTHASAPKQSTSSVLGLPDVPRGRSLYTSFRGPAPRQRNSILDFPDTSEARSLGSSIHAPAVKQNIPVMDLIGTPKARSLNSSIHAPTPKRGPVVLTNPGPSKAYSLGTSIHAPSPKRNAPVRNHSNIPRARPSYPSIHAPTPKRRDLISDLPGAPEVGSLGASIHAPPPKRSAPAPNMLHVPRASSSRSSIHAPAPRQSTSDFDLPNESEARSLGSSIHAPTNKQNTPTHVEQDGPSLDFLGSSQVRSLGSSIHAPTSRQSSHALNRPRPCPTPNRPIRVPAPKFPMRNRPLGVATGPSPPAKGKAGRQQTWTRKGNPEAPARGRRGN